MDPNRAWQDLAQAVADDGRGLVFGQDPALRVSRSARRSLTLWSACLLTPQGGLFQECFSPIRHLLEPLKMLPVGATSYRAGFSTR